MVLTSPKRHSRIPCHVLLELFFEQTATINFDYFGIRWNSFPLWKLQNGYADQRVKFNSFRVPFSGTPRKQGKTANNCLKKGSCFLVLKSIFKRTRALQYASVESVSWKIIYRLHSPARSAHSHVPLTSLLTCQCGRRSPAPALSASLPLAAENIAFVCSQKADAARHGTAARVRAVNGGAALLCNNLKLD